MFTIKIEQYNISGMSCAACSASVERVVSRLDGVKECTVNLITGKMTVKYNEKKVSEEDFFRVVKKAGFGISLDENKKNSKQTEQKNSAVLPVIISAVLSSVLLYISMGQMLFKNLPLPQIIDINLNPYNFALTQLLLCIPVIFFGRKFFLKGLPLLFKGHPNMDSLVAIGATASFLYSIVMIYSINTSEHAVHNLYFESVAVVITLVMTGKFFEQRSRNKTTDSIKKLMALSPDTTTVFRNGSEIVVPTKDINVGDIIIVKAGEKIALDGIIENGNGACDESMLTGESIPVEKNTGDSVTGGSINLNGLFYIKVTHTGDDTTLSKIIRFVQEAQAKKAPISKTADFVAGIFVPVVIVIALLAFAVWFFIEKDIGLALKIFTSVLVVACPCALGLATPTAIMVGTGLGAVNGILIRNGEILEVTHKIKVAVFDKTGTVTMGKPIVTDVYSSDNEKLIRYAAIAEKGSTHPLALATTEYAETKGIDFSSSPQDFESFSGKGIKCTIDKNCILVGNLHFLSDNGIITNDYMTVAEKFASEGKSTVFVAENNVVSGVIAIADKLKSSSKQAFDALKSMGIKTVLLSGDNKLCANNIGKALGADEIYSEVLPQEKAIILSEMQKKYGKVMMIGDGINDAPALSKADIGCAIGNGSDIAIEAADIVLMKNDPCDVAKAINLSRLTIKNIKQNLFWAFCYNCVCIPIAAGVLYAFGGPLLSPMLAGLAMSLSSVFVVGNALRLRGKKI